MLRGRVFTGDRITIALGFMQTTVMEMGEPAGARESRPGGSVAARQCTGRLVRVTNDKIFDMPVFNHTREFPFFWDEIHLPTRYGDDRGKVERILLDSARRHTASYLEDAANALENLRAAYLLPEATQLEPQTYYRLTDNWLELTVRFVAPQRGVRIIKDAISRDVLRELEQAGIGIASATYEIVGLPPLLVDGARGSSLGPEHRGD